MGKRKGKKEVVQDELVEQAEGQDPTFAEAVGHPANAHAKKLARKAAKEKNKPGTIGVIYTKKGEHKIIKLIVKKGKVYSVYVGSLKKHKEAIAPFIKKWIKEGSWCEPADVDQKIDSLLGRKPRPKGIIAELEKADAKPPVSYGEEVVGPTAADEMND